MTPRHALAAVAVAIIWGANFVIIDAGLHDMPPLLFVALRFLAVVVPAIFVVRRPAVPWRDIALVGLFLSIGQFGLLYLSLDLGMPPGLASLVVQVQVIFTVVIAAVSLKERPSRRQQLGIVVGLVGLAVVALGRNAATPWLALVLCLAGALSWATGNVVIRRVGTASGLGMTVWSGLFVPIPMLTLSLLVDGPQAVATGLRHIDLVTIGSTLYTACLCSLFGYGVWNSLLARYPTASVVPFTLLVPVSGIATAWVFRNERPTFGTVVGGLLLLAGVLVTSLGRRRRASRPPVQLLTSPTLRR
ncbi:EamA family transporter [Lapillicoccus sp.]|uniref:EamA family transporter n=1 Tax=Lapillicoccus sp. TaxID=1909287 RepID=UPI0027C9DBAD|nr:EamA family transporter [Actinomycetota bacterium]